MATHAANTKDAHSTNDHDFTADVVGLHTTDRSPCPLSGEAEHRHHRGRPLNPDCAALGGRNGYGFQCTCGALRPSGSKLAAIEDKARHLALHRGDLLVHRIVRASDGPSVIQEIHALHH
ncbi:hypothetical protein [Streptomyces violascens]|uniref:hypothetical protein n=1 Tax=Streptomyces violascens TaxID=67381 RepID=UPI0016753972|nr:hypothetical protein [Streptomyces violascens]GGU49494.1 hypothetical protein GCM10010289_82520 [Streptomyces violascens]